MIKVLKLSVIWAKRNALAKVSVGGFRLRTVEVEVRQNTESWVAYSRINIYIETSSLSTVN